MTKFYKRASKIEMHSLQNNYVGSVNKYLYKREENAAVSNKLMWSQFSVLRIKAFGAMPGSELTTPDSDTRANKTATREKIYKERLNVRGPKLKF